MFRNIAAAIEGTFAGGVFVLTAENLGITYAPFHDAAVSAEAAANVEMVRAGLADGSNHHRSVRHRRPVPGRRLGLRLTDPAINN